RGPDRRRHAGLRPAAVEHRRRRDPGGVVGAPEACRARIAALLHLAARPKQRQISTMVRTRLRLDWPLTRKVEAFRAHDRLQYPAQTGSAAEALNKQRPAYARRSFEA